MPADRSDFLLKSEASEADALIVDLEDGVAALAKESARRNLADWLTRRAPSSKPVVVRITADSPAEDLLSLSRSIDAVMVPKAEPSAIDEVSALLTERELALGVAHGSIRIIALVETAKGVVLAHETASRSRVVRFAVGRADLTADLRLSIDPDGPEFRYLVLPLVVAGAAAGLDAPIAPTSTRISELEQLRQSTQDFGRWGFRARTAVHPTQLSVINDVFTPTREESDEAEELVRAYEQATSTGSGVFIDSRGRMIDAAVVRSAYETLSRVGKNTAE